MTANRWNGDEGGSLEGRGPAVVGDPRPYPRRDPPHYFKNLRMIRGQIPRQKSAHDGRSDCAISGGRSAARVPARGSTLRNAQTPGATRAATGSSRSSPCGRTPAGHRTRGDEFWWPQALLAAGLGVSRRTVGRWLQQLEREGIVERRYASPGRPRFHYGLRPYFRKKQVPLRMHNGHQEAFRCPLKLERAWQDETLYFFGAPGLRR